MNLNEIMKMNTSMDNTFLQYASSVLGDTNYGLSGKEIIGYCSEYAAKRDIALPDYNKNQNKQTNLLKFLQAFTTVQCVNLINELTLLPKFENNSKIKELRHKLIKKFGNLIKGKITNTEIVSQTRHWLEQYPNSLKHYNDSLSKYEIGHYTRNTLDDMRLSLEVLLKNIFNNSQSTERQYDLILAELKNKGVSPELRNTFKSIIDMYCKYQNNYVKHDEKFNEQEVEYVIEQTSVMMKFLIKILG